MSWACPGDHIVYRDKTLYINGVVMPRDRCGEYTGPDAGGMELSDEKFGANEHQVLSGAGGWQPRRRMDRTGRRSIS